MVTNLWKKGIVIGIIILFLLPGITAGAEKNIFNSNQKTIIPKILTNDPADTVPITLAVYGTSRMKPQTTSVSAEDANTISLLFKELKTSMTSHPFDERTEQLKQEFVTLLAQYHLLPVGIYPDQYSTLLNPPWFEKLRKKHTALSSGDSTVKPDDIGITSALFCSIGGEGVGFLLPLFLLPRPRIITTWASPSGVTLVGKLISVGGFLASGSQFGVALGFWGIGLTFATPYGTLYGFTGYSLFTSVAADYIERYPPDYPPEILETNPEDDATDIPITLQEISFSIKDSSEDLMRYSVTTTPNIGSGKGRLKTDGTYSIPVEGLQGLTEYSWTLKVSDDVQTTQQTFTFTTEGEAPEVSNERPLDGDRYVPETQNYLSFHLRDPQDDPMSYTVETSPFIGTESGSGVNERDISVPISGLEVLTEYRWFVNATDGENQMSEEFWFRTGPLTVFDPFAKGWMYRKMITIDHTMVAGDLQNFPVLLNFTDLNLRDKAQDDGDDILFMDGAGVATRLYHEIEEFDGTTGRLIAWVNISSLQSTADTEFYLYYGNMSSVDQQCPVKVWDGNYEAVYHMNDETSSTIVDSTAHNHDLTKYASDSPSESPDGKVGNCQSFDGSYDWMTAPTWSTGNKLTVSVWVKAEHNFTDNYYRIYQIEDEGSTYDYAAHSFSVSDSWQPTFGCDLASCSNQYIRYSDCVISQNQWTYLGVTRAVASRANLFINGMKATGTITERSDDWKGAIDYDANGDFKIGVFKQDSTIPYGASWWGDIDEFRLSSCVRSDSWMSTEYTSMMNPSSFVSIGPEETGP